MDANLVGLKRQYFALREEYESQMRLRTRKLEIYDRKVEEFKAKRARRLSAQAAKELK